jgi:L-asparagine transporter-like permease
MPLFPYLQILGIILLAAILITMGLDTDFWNISWIVGIPWMIAISIAYAIWKRLQKASSTTAEYLGSG